MNFNPGPFKGVNIGGTKITITVPSYVESKISMTDCIKDHGCTKDDYLGKWTVYPAVHGYKSTCTTLKYDVGIMDKAELPRTKPPYTPLVNVVQFTELCDAKEPQTYMGSYGRNANGGYSCFLEL